MSLSYNKSGFRIEHAVIAVLGVLLVGVLVYFLMGKQAPQAALEQAPVAAPVATAEVPASAAAPLQQPVGFGMAVGEFEGEVHPIIDILAKLKGFKYDESVAPADTVYIIYDPRCPYCHGLFDKIKTIDLKAKKITIKWLPSLALGETEEAKKFAAMGFDAKSVADFEASFKPDTDVSGVKPTAAHQDAINDNTAFLFEASDQTFGPDHPKSVPAVFFIDKKTGAPNMMYGAADDSIFRQIFGD